MSEQFPPQYALHNATFAVGAELSLVRSLPVKKFFGLLNGRAILDYPEISESAYTYSMNDGKQTYVKVGFFETSAGKKIFATYLAALKQVVERHHPKLDAFFIAKLVEWEMTITVVDNTTAQGFRQIECIENTDKVMESFENTLTALRRPHKDKTPLVLNFNNENYDNEESDIYDQYLYCAEYMAIEGDVVKIHFYDYEDKPMGLHKVSLDKAELTNMLLRTHAQLKKHIEEICKVLGISLNEVNHLLERQ